MNLENIKHLTAEEFRIMFCNSDMGTLSAYPIEETAMRAFGLTMTDVEPYLSDKRDGLEILCEILQNKGILQKKYSGSC